MIQNSTRRLQQLRWKYFSWAVNNPIAFKYPKKFQIIDLNFYKFSFAGLKIQVLVLNSLGELKFHHSQFFLFYLYG